MEFAELVDFLEAARLSLYQPDCQTRSNLKPNGLCAKYDKGYWSAHLHSVGLERKMETTHISYNGSVVYVLTATGKFNAGVYTTRACMFLYQALRQPAGELGVRGPNLFEDSDWVYLSQTNGGYYSQNGSEIIKLDERIVYEGQFTGTCIQ